MDPAAHDPGLLVQAVEGMERPLFVLDEDWRFRYINPAGARVLARTVDELVGQDVWAAFPEAVGGPFEELYRRVRATGVSGSVEAWFEPLGRWFRADAFRTDAGLVVTYDDVTERRRTEEERARAAAEAERAGRHLMLLGDINLAMTSTVDADEAVDRFAHLVVPVLADWCLVSVIDPDGTRRDVGRAHSDPAMVEAMHRYADSRVRTNAPSAPVPQSLRSGRSVVIEALTAADVGAMVSDPAARQVLGVLRPAAVAAFPLVARGEVIGAFTLVNGPERGAHTPAELRTAEIASRRAALALDNARLARANQQVAERLQVSLLSPPVQPDDLELAVRYRAATRGVSIGGDWYDSFLQPDGDTVVVIGDVMGHDIEAAAAMGQVKTLVRAIAFDRLEEPAGLLRRVDHALVGLAVPAMATALVCRLEQTPTERTAGLRRLRWSTAGHPEPMLLGPDGTVTDLSAPVGPPLGIGWRGPRADGEVVLPEGATLLLFTDGLFERRSVPLDEGRDQLRGCLRVAAREEATLDQLCDRLLAEMVGEGAEDDVALLAVRLHPVDGERPSPSGPVLVQPVARRP
ncbi:PP2C family protein-serine/threonine phosphatase [Geodermatophilus sabuli]|uniref:Serine phosphatase RsbU, regulator of sigma subunit n=1 Tax=Geodermatophilus sabuli TaxID=1564158 RepID=A0A285EF70_9ACTN|nr:SpoIIE family protein phosphatase [Geodermatophilus sabuli]MBB3086156.1 serine phosphatase RsbU (regulator of sigma subunit) [Geodermatophilus sabuli]SNX97627.1 Serine phosphatase RsbU, regulator of sigma subunit [Geodermatophilus sabuli]